MNFKIGDIVAPNHKGIDIDWAQFRGRLVGIWHSAGATGEPVGDVVWFREAKFAIAPRSDGYPLDMLSVITGGRRPARAP